jgi:crotonobetainyl-CoA:carnitine CoA-transferase CaiB-like acyl-CoA transferase
VARESIVAVHDAKLVAVRMQAPTPRLSVTPGKINFTGPQLGEHNHEVYHEPLGKTADDLDASRRRSAAGRVVVDVNR